MLSLTIQHNVHLTKQQRYDLHAGKNVETIGYSVPVWYLNKTTSEPGKEFFCRYVLKNPKEELPIRILEDGYEITIPYREGSKLDLSDEEWRILNETNPMKLQEMYRDLIPEVSSQRLLDLKDGGNGGTLVYREQNKVSRNDETLNVMHYVCIEPIESLISSLALQ
jgi:hypothetical protein